MSSREEPSHQVVVQWCQWMLCVHVFMPTVASKLLLETLSLLLPLLSYANPTTGTGSCTSSTSSFHKFYPINLERERERQTDRDRDRETETERQRQTDRQTDRDRQTETETDRQTDRQTEKETDRQTERTCVCVKE